MPMDWSTANSRLPGQNARQHGVDEVQHAHQADDEAQGAAQGQEHTAEALELVHVALLTLVVVDGLDSFGIVRQKGLHGIVGLLRGVIGVDHDQIGAGVLLEPLRAQDIVVAPHDAVPEGQGAGHRHQGADGVFFLLIDLGAAHKGVVVPAVIPASISSGESSSPVVRSRDTHSDT